jgi:hypothetical protein
MLNGNEIWREVATSKKLLTDLFNIKGKDIIRDSLALTNDENIPGAVDDYTSGFTDALKHGQYVYWDSNILKAASEGYELFNNKPFPAFNPKVQVWICGPGNLWIDYLPNGNPAVSIGTIIEQHVSGAVLVGHIIIPYDGDNTTISSFKKQVLVHIATTGTMGDRGPIAIGFMSQILAALEFMNQPFVEKNNLDRVAMFNGSGRQDKRNDAKKFQIVYLRRRAQDGGPVKDSDGHQIDWSCQWMVKGHWRNQYHPRSQEHRPAFIQSYVKGPEDKPFRASPETIFAAVR